MTQRSFAKILVPALFFLGACATPPVVLVPSSGTPVYDKFGGVSFCIGPDGGEYPANRSANDPCEEPACPGGYTSAAGELICPEDIQRTFGQDGRGSSDPGRGNTTTPRGTFP